MQNKAAKPTTEIASPYKGVRLFRSEKIIFAMFEAPHSVISTSRINGGMQEGLKIAANHQACEPRPCFSDGHSRCLAVREPEKYHRLVCDYHGLDPEKTCLMGTAANMNCAGMAQESFNGLKVFAIVTAGVETNAGRAGDPAAVYETPDGFKPVGELKKDIQPDSGTINTLLLINQPLTPAALVRTVKMATEAKTSILQELNVGSKYSSGLATGTGTDQICICSMNSDMKPLTGAGKHVKLGEMIALAVREALRQALDIQNHLTPVNVRFLPRLTARFGLTEDRIMSEMKKSLDKKAYECLERNPWTFYGDPTILAHVLGFVHTLDQIQWGIIPQNNATEILVSQAALIAAAVSGKSERFTTYLAMLKADKRDDPIDLLIQAFSIGFSEKWEVPWHR